MSIGLRGALPPTTAFSNHAQDLESSHRLIRGAVHGSRMDSARLIACAISSIRSSVGDFRVMVRELGRVVLYVRNDPAFKDLYSVFFRTLIPFLRPLTQLFTQAEQFHYMTLASRTRSLETFCEASEYLKSSLKDPYLIGVNARLKRQLEPAHDPIEYISSLSPQSMCPVDLYLYILEVGAQPIILDSLVRDAIDSTPPDIRDRRYFLLWQIYSEIYRDLDPAECHRRYAMMTDFFEAKNRLYAYASWARFAYKKGEKESACHIFNQALDRVEAIQHRKIHLMLALLYAEIADPVRSLFHVEKAIECISISDVHITVLAIAHVFRHLGLSADLFIAFLNGSFSTNQEIHFACIVFEMKSGRLDRARELSIKYLDLYPENPKIQWLWLFLHKNVVPESIWLEKCAQFLSATPRSAEILTEYALHLLRENNLQEALFYAEMARRSYDKINGDALIVCLYCLVRMQAPEERYAHLLAELMPLWLNDIHVVFCCGIFWNIFHISPGMTIYDTFRLIRSYFEENQDLNFGYCIPDVASEPIDVFKGSLMKMRCLFL